MKPLRFILSGFWLSFAAAVILLALLLSAVRLMLPAAGEYRGEVAAWVGDILGQPVKIGGLGASWHGWGPSVELRDVTVLDSTGRQAVLECASARIDINVPASLREWQFEPGLLTVRGMHVSVVRRADGGIAVAGLEGAEGGGMDESSKAALKLWVQRQERLSIEHSSLLWRDLTDGGKTLEFTDINLQLRNRGDRHRLDGTVNLPESLGQSLEVAMDVRGDLFTSDFWNGQVYARGTGLRLAGWWGKQASLGMAALDGTVDFRVWSDWLSGAQQAEGEIHARDLQATRAAAPTATAAAAVQPVDIADLAGGFHWQRHRPGWTLDVDNFSITRRGAASPPAQVRVEYAQDERTGGRDLRAAYSELRAEDVAGLLLEADLVPDDLRERLGAMAPQGVLRDGYLEYHDAPQQAPRFVVRSDFAGLAWRPSAPLPGMQGVTGKVTADEQQGLVTLATEKAAVDFADLFRAPLPVDTLAGEIAWRRDDKTLQIVAPEMTAGNEDLNLKFGFHVDAPRDGASPYLDFNASFGEGKGAHVSRYLPAKIMGAETVAWLDKAIVNGRVSNGTARIQGRLADFPFDDGQGLFDIRFEVSDGILEYAPGWPRLEEIDTEIVFHGRRFEADTASAKSLDSEVLQAKIAIPDMTAHPAELNVEGKAQGPVADAVRYVTESPLRDKIGSYLGNIAAGGQSRLQLSLNLPLAKLLPARVKGSLRISDGSLLFRNADIDLTHIDGALNFTERGLSADAVHADLFGQAVVISANTKAGPAGAVTTFSARGTADAAVLARRFAPALAPYVQGAAPWQGELRIPPQSEGWVELQVVSPLRGVAVSLPPPMAKPADEARKLLLQIPLPLQDEKPVHLRYGDIADAQLALKNGAAGMAVARGEVLFGGGTAALPTAGIRLAGTLPDFDASQWSAILWPPQAPGKPAATIPAVAEMDMHFGVLKVAGRQLDKVGIQAKRSDAAWDVAISSEQVQGRIVVPDKDDAPLVMDMDRLYLPHFKKGGGGESAPDPRRMHPLDIKAKSFHYGGLDLGALQVRASRVAAGLSFDEVHAHSEQRDLQIKGTWLLEGAAQQSSFTLVYDGEDAGGTLTALGFAGVIVGGKAHTDMRLKWQGAPTAFSLAKAAGSVSFEIKDGRLLDVEPGAGRILGLLSFQALPRHLLLDFSDLFKKGFSFDSLAGSFTIENGNAQTDNLHMNGPSARITARGRVGLAAEDYDQRVTVTPNVTGGLPVAGVIAGGAAGGAAMYLAEKLLKPGIDLITQVEYHVTGPWANPTVEKLTTVGQGTKANGQGK